MHDLKALPSIYSRKTLLTMHFNRIYFCLAQGLRISEGRKFLGYHLTYIKFGAICDIYIS